MKQYVIGPYYKIVQQRKPPTPSQLAKQQQVRESLTKDVTNTHKQPVTQ